MAAQHDGCYLLKFVGDVRVTLCKTIDDYIEIMLSDEAFTDVAVDLSEVEGIDSTTLGLLANLSMQVRERLGYRPIVYSPRPGITRLLSSMGFQTIYTITADLPQSKDNLDALPISGITEEGCRERVIEAHRILMDINEKNRAKFQPLISMLEHS